VGAVWVESTAQEKDLAERKQHLINDSTTIACLKEEVGRMANEICEREERLRKDHAGLEDNRAQIKYLQSRLRAVGQEQSLGHLRDHGTVSKHFNKTSSDFLPMSLPRGWTIHCLCFGIV